MRSDALLRAALLTNALFSAACALILLAAPVSVGTWTGLDGVAAYVALGTGLLAFAAGLAFLAARPVLPTGWVRAATLADFLWVAATAGILASPWTSAFSERGLWTLVVVAQFVLFCGVLQAIGLRIADAPASGASS
jgi:hypothetical protein